MYSVVGNNVWVNFTVTYHFLVVRVLPLPINLGLGPHWNMVGAILYSGAAQSHLARLDSFQARVENMCGVSFPPIPLIVHRNASILGLTCRLLAGEGRDN